VEPQRTTAATPYAERPDAGVSLDLARARGRAEAERFERRLREREGRTREELLGHRLLAADDPAQAIDLATAGGGDAQLRRQLETLREFHAAVVRSRGWRLLQALRRPFGRAW
jgi:hypothetical protein